MALGESLMNGESLMMFFFLFSICGVFPPLGNFLIARVNPFALVALVGAIAVVVTTLFIDYK